jgi:hypothetical protein
MNQQYTVKLWKISSYWKLLLCAHCFTYAQVKDAGTEELYPVLLLQVLYEQWTCLLSLRFLLINRIWINSWIFMQRKIFLFAYKLKLSQTGTSTPCVCIIPNFCLTTSVIVVSISCWQQHSMPQFSSGIRMHEEHLNMMNRTLHFQWLLAVLCSDRLSISFSQDRCSFLKRVD